jgi:hypothetical protein
MVRGAISAPRSFHHRPPMCHPSLEGAAHRCRAAGVSALHFCSQSMRDAPGGCPHETFHCVLVVGQKYGRHGASAGPIITGALVCATLAAGVRRRITRQHCPDIRTTRGKPHEAGRDADVARLIRRRRAGSI